MNPVQDPYDRRPQPIDWQRPNMLVALAARDFTTVYRQLQKIGYSQNHIGRLTRQAQPEVSAIIHGRRVMAYDLMDKIITGLGIPRCLVGMASSCDDHCVQHPASQQRPPIGLQLYDHPDETPDDPWTPEAIDI